MSFRTLLSLLLFAAVARAAPEGVHLVATSDGEGALLTCSDCPMGLGGLARRATLLSKERDAVIVDGGNSLFGPESLSSHGRAVAEFYDRLGYDAMNVSYRDFRLGRETLEAAVRDLKLSVLSANLADSGSGELLFAPSALVTRAGRRVLIVGVCAAPAGRGRLPHLVRQLRGVDFRPVGPAVSAALEAAPEHDDAILLYYGPVAGLKRDLGELLSRFRAVVLGGTHPDELPANFPLPLLAARPRGKSMVRLAVGGGGSPEETLVSPDVPEDPEIASAVARELEVGETEPAPLPRGVAPGIPDRPGRVSGEVEVRGEGENRGFGLIVHGATLTWNLGNARPPRGRRLLLVDVSVENRLSPDLLLEDSFPETMQVMDVRRQFFLVENGDRIRQVLPAAVAQEGHLPRSFRIGTGRAADGLIAFPIAVEGLDALDLRFYPDGFEPIVIPLKAGPAAPARKPLAGPFENGEVELTVTDFRLEESHAGQKPGEGRVFAVVDLRGRSLLRSTTPALAVREDAAAGQEETVGQVFEWKMGDRLLQLVTGGLWGFVPHELTGPGGETPMFLPDLDGLHRLVFEVPVGEQSFRLDAQFPRMKLNTEREFRMPPPIVFPLRGEEPGGGRKALAVVDDRPLVMGVLEAELTEEFAGSASGKNNRFAVLTVAFRNEGEEGGMLDPAERFGISWAGRKPSPPMTTSRHHPRPGGGMAWLPPGQVRAFQLVWRVPREESALSLRYLGVSTAKRIPLDLGSPGLAEEVLTGGDAGASVTPGVQSAPPARREPKGLAGFGIDPADVNRAIARGREFLWNYLLEDQITDRSPFGSQRTHTLAALALLHASGMAELPGFESNLRELLETAGLRSAYEKGLYLMSVRSYGDPEFLPRAREVAQDLIDQQGPDGSWTYGEPIPAVRKKPAPEPGPAAPKPQMAEAEGPTVTDGPFAVTGSAPPPKVAESEPEPVGTEREGLERRVPWEEGKDGDNSCSQFALLGLRAAKSIGIGIPKETWRRALESFRVRQDPSGSFGYGANGGYGSMTCAGICSIALARHGLGEEGAARDPAIDRALDWLERRFRPDSNPERDLWHYYYIYSLERVGRLLDTEFIGPWEWYPLGVRSLLARQRADGSWVGEGGEKKAEIATSFALLFLTRATEVLEPKTPHRPAVEKRKEPPPGPGRLVTGAKGPAANRFYFILDASGSMRIWGDGQTRFDLAREALRDLVAGLPGDAQVALRVYGHRYDQRESAANTDSALEIPLGKLDLERFEKVLSGLEPKGRTPMAYSLDQATKDLRAIRGPVQVVLLTDGGEDADPPRDPVAAVREFAAAGNVQLTLIGLAIGKEKEQQQLEAMAEAAGTTARFPRDGTELIESLNATATPADFTVLDEDGTVVGKGTFGDALELPAGRYQLRTTDGGRDQTVPFHLRPGKTVRIVYDPAER